MIEIAYSCTVLLLTLYVLRALCWDRDHFVVHPLGAFIGLELIVSWIALSPLSGLSGANSFTLSLVASGTLGLLLTFLALESVQPTSPALRAWYDRRLEPIPGSQVTIWVIAGLLFGLALIDVRGILTPNALLNALTDPLSGDAGAIRQGRAAATKSHLFGGNWQGQGIRNALITNGWLFLWPLATVNHFRNRTTSSRRTLGVIWIGGVILLLSTGVRSHIVFVLVSTAVATSMTRRIGIKAALRPLFALVGFLIAIAPLGKGTFGDGGFGANLRQLSRRIFEGNSSNSVAIIEFIDEGILTYQDGGIFWERARAALPGVSSGDRPFVNDLAILRGANPNTTSYSTPTQLGLWYGDWGEVGVVFGYVLSAVALWALARFIFGRYRPKNEATVAFAAAAVTIGARSAIGGILAIVPAMMALMFFYSISLMVARVSQRESVVLLPRADLPTPR